MPTVRERVVSTFLAAMASMPAGLSGQTPTGFLDRTITVDGVSHSYQVYVPRNYEATRTWPTILFLHGAGERGKDGLIQTEVGLGSAIRRMPDRYPAIVIFPQVPQDSTWQGVPGRVAMSALDRTLEEFNTDPTRVYLTGMSMGGNGTWYLAYEHPDRFAAIAAICGFVSGSRLVGSFLPEGDGSPFGRLADRIRGIPIWIVHGDVDTVVPVAESRSMYDALRTAGANVRYIELPGVGHNSWDPAYDSPELPAWLFAQKR